MFSASSIRSFALLRTINAVLPAAATMLFLLITPGSGSAQTKADAVLKTQIRTLEQQLDARIGVQIRDSASDWRWGYRATERFLMASTFKPLLCGAILDQVDKGALALTDPLPIRADDILAYAPVTKDHAGGALSIADLCFATLDLSDNTAANLLIKRLGGPQAVTAYLRRIGDTETRLDRMEPALNRFVSGDPRDTTTPAAMLATWDKMLLGDGLSPASQTQLIAWMEPGAVTGELIRTSLPTGWRIADKSGGGRTHTRNIVAMITPPARAPLFVAIFVSDRQASWQERNMAVIRIGAAVIELLKTR